ncbi:MAG: hypothetical protein U0271_25235 [Polyangiaceae bacterium]
MSSPFTKCAACDRHIRTRELACPFCSAPRTPVADGGELRVPFARRAAVFLAASVAVAGCGGTKTANKDGSSSASSTATTASATNPTTSGASTSASTVEPTAPATRYGLPPYLAADELI